MKVKVPKEIKLGIYRYKIKFDKTMQLVSGNVGEHRPSNGEIALAPYMSEPSRIITLNHEVLHHISDQYRMHLDEDAVDRLAFGWAEFMQSLGIELDWSDIREDIK